MVGLQSATLSKFRFRYFSQHIAKLQLSVLKTLLTTVRVTRMVGHLERLQREQVCSGTKETSEGKIQSTYLRGLVICKFNEI